jgi:peptidoglycan/xylan/chitin deacetylase (PgdA/CDA1 family)
MKTNHKLRIANYLLLLTILTACSSAPATPDQNIAMTAAFGTAFAQLSQPSQTPAPSETPIPTATVPRTPPALPGAFQTNFLEIGSVPHTYITDSCEYLKNKWTSTNAAPGTIVMVIMFHGINKDANSVDENDISVQDFKKLMNSLKELGFEAINATQIADFLDKNAYIPPRSVVLTYDDRHFASAFDHFRPYHEKWNWPVVNGWISAFGGQDNVLAENVALEKEGWVDHQAHGVVHNTPMGDSSPEKYLRSELQGSIDVLQQYYGKTPVAIIWPGGGFGLRPAQMARQLGYRVGFTVNPRGPIMYNWIPLADAADPRSPMWLPEGPANDPRMTLPRYWPIQAMNQMDIIRTISNDATNYAQQNKPIELDYYNIVCAPAYGPIP